VFFVVFVRAARHFSVFPSFAWKGGPFVLLASAVVVVEAARRGVRTLSHSFSLARARARTHVPLPPKTTHDTTQKNIQKNDN